MEFIQNKEIIVIFDKRMGLETIASKLALLNGEQTKKFFMERLIKIPRKINAMALTSALNERIKTLDSHSLSRDGFIKLESYATFTEFQLQSLFEKIGTDGDFYLYRKNLWKLLLRNHIGINLQDGEVTRLINMRKNNIEPFSEYSKALFSVTLDATKEFDAYPKDGLETLLKYSYSQEEIRMLASKYGFDIPQRLKKDDLLAYVKDMMKSKKKLTLALQRELNAMTISQLNDYCSLQGLGISSQMKKDELINLLLFLVKNAKFSAIEAKKIYGMDFSEPLKFRVDLDAIDSFKRGFPKKVILLEEDEIEELEKLDELIEEEPPVKKPTSNEDVVTGVIKKLLPYLNVDEDAAKVASQHGINVALQEEPKKATKTTLSQENKVAPQPKKQTVKTEQTKGKVDEAFLEEIMKKFHGMKENEPALANDTKKNDQALLDEILEKLQKITDAQEKIKEELQATKQEQKTVTEPTVHITREYDEDDVDDDEFSDYDFEPEEDIDESMDDKKQEEDKKPIDPEELITKLKQEAQGSAALEDQPSLEESLEETKEEDSLETIDEVASLENDSMVETSIPEDVVLNEGDESSEEALSEEGYNKESEPQEEHLSEEETKEELLEESNEELSNESYDKEFEPIEDFSKEEDSSEELANEDSNEEEESLKEMIPSDEPLKEEAPIQYMLSTYVEGLSSEPKNEEESSSEELENNPYFGKKKILSNKKPLIITLLSIVLCIGVFISIFAILNALK